MNTSEPSDGTSTARDMTASDWKLWVQPKGGQRFLLDWGTESAIRAKLEAETFRDVWIESADGQSSVRLRMSGAAETIP